MRTRVASPADLPALLALERAAPSTAHWSRQQYASVFRDEDRLCLVLEVEAGIQGFLVAHTVGTDWELENIVVATSAQRRGLGAALMLEVVGRAQGTNAAGIFLEVRESNQAARRLYAKCGFVETGRRKSYYSDPQEDAILYTHRLR